MDVLMYAAIIPVMLIVTFMVLPVYIALMSVKNRIDNVPTIPKAMLYMWFYIFMVIDVIVYNWIFGTFFLFELPKWGEWTLSERLTRHVSYSRDFRQERAIWFCLTFLSPFDPSGKHCGDL